MTKEKNKETKKKQLPLINHVFKRRKIQTKITINERNLYLVEFGGMWSIIIMPDRIVIDNYHNKEPHIHANPEKHYIYLETKLKDNT